MSARVSLLNGIKRISQMGSEEVCVRTSQAIFKRLDFAKAKIGISLSGGELDCPFGGRGTFFFRSDEIPEILAWLRAHLPQTSQQIIGQADGILAHRFELLGYEAVGYGEEIDWHRDAVHGKSAARIPWYRLDYLDFRNVGDHKITWELNRHQHLVTLAKAYRLTDGRRYAKELFRQWYHWQKQNPYPIGINWASSLEIAFRSLSWLWVWHLMEGSPLMPKSFPFDLQRALMQNGRHIERYLSTYFAPNTHLLGEAVALFFIGSLSPWSPAVDRWRELGWQTILREAHCQILPDGMHFEQSTYYHSYALDLFLHARVLARRNKFPIPASFDRKLEEMLEALSALHRAGPVPSFGDDDGGRIFDPRRNQREHVADPLVLGSALYHRPDFKQRALRPTEELVWLLGAETANRFEALPTAAPSVKSFALESSGIYVMAGAGASSQQLAIDAGPQGPGFAGHGHADALSVQVSADGKTILVDPGTYSYVNDEGHRDHFRCTASHNTVQIDGVGQSEPAGLFKWTALAETTVNRWAAGSGFNLFVGSHSGYGRLTNPVIHQRSVFYLKPHFWLVRDVLQGAGTHQVDIGWHFAPGTLSTIPGGVEFLGDDQAQLTMLFASDSQFSPGVSQGWYSRSYGNRQPSPIACVSAKAELPAEFTTLLIPTAGKATLRSVPVNSGDCISAVRHYELSWDRKTHQIFFADRPGQWNTDRIASDASFAYCALAENGQLENFAMCGGTYLAVDGVRVLASSTPIAKAESFGINVKEPTVLSPSSGAKEKFAARNASNAAAWTESATPSQSLRSA